MVNYVRVDRRIAKTDSVVKRVLNEAALIPEHKVLNTHVYDKLLIASTLFEANMQTILKELEKFKTCG